MSPDWADMPPKTRQKIEHADGDEPEQHENRAADAWNSVALQPADRRSGDRAEHRGEDHRHDDRRGLASSQMSPTMISTNPTSSHDEKPRFLSHVGAET